MSNYSSLRQVVERSGPLDCKRAARYVQEIAQQLSDMESSGQPIGDVRPGNIFLDETGTARLASTIFDISMDGSNVAEGDVTDIVDCLAPERALNSGSADRRADIYSLGCVFYYLLTGVRPFGVGTVSERLLKHQTALPNAIDDVRQDVPETLVHICERMIQKRPEDRFATAREVVDVIATWRQDADHQGH